MKEDILKKFIEHFTTNFRQVDENGNLRYVFCGSLALNLLSQTNDINLIDTKNQESSRKQISDSLKSVLVKNQRTMHDIDLAIIDQDLYEKSSNDELRLDISDFVDLFYGRKKEPEFSKIPKELVPKESLIIDGFKTQLPEQVAQINMGNINVVTSTSKDLFCYKVPFALRQFDETFDTKEGIENKRKDNIKDLTLLYILTTRMGYTKEELVRGIGNVLESLLKDERDGFDFHDYLSKLSTNIPNTENFNKLRSTISEGIDEFYRRRDESKGETLEESSKNISLIQYDNSLVGKIKNFFTSIKDMTAKDISKGVFKKIGDSIKNVFGKKNESHDGQSDSRKEDNGLSTTQEEALLFEQRLRQGVTDPVIPKKLNDSTKANTRNKENEDSEIGI